MPKNHPTRRELLTATSAGAALALMFTGDSRVANAQAAEPPWAKRFFNLFTNAEGLAEIREIELPGPGAQPPNYLLRHPAARVTVGGMAPDFMYDWHVANQPNILITLFGTLVVELRNGRRYEFGLGDILFAEDCTGSGHRSGAGSEGQFGVSVQLEKALCPAPGESMVEQLLRK